MLDAESTVLPIGLAFAVLKGLEDLALEGVLKCLKIWDETLLDIISISAPLFSGHIMLRFLGSQGAAGLIQCRQCYESGHMRSIESAFLLVADVELESTRRELHEAFIHKMTAGDPHKMARKQAGDYRALKNTPAKIEHVSLERAPSELTFLDDIRGCISNAREKLTTALSFFPAGQMKNHTFRGSAHNPSHFLPFTTLTSTEIAQFVGEEIFDWLNGGQQDTPWKVGLTNPDLNVDLRIVGVPPVWKPATDGDHLHDVNPPCVSQPHFPSTLRILLTLALPAPALGTDALLEKGRTSLPRSTAHLFVCLNPLLSPSSTRDGLVLLDPCAGTGSIPSELASHSGGRALVMAGDIVLNNVARIPRSLDIESFAWDGAGLGGSPRDGIVDGIVSDLPYGMRELSPALVKRLYPRLLANLARVSSPGAYAVLATAAAPLLRRTLAQQTNKWTIVPIPRNGVVHPGTPMEREIFVGGMRSWMFLLKRNSTLPPQVISPATTH